MGDVLVEVEVEVHSVHQVGRGGVVLAEDGLGLGGRGGGLVCVVLGVEAVGVLGCLLGGVWKGGSVHVCVLGAGGCECLSNRRSGERVVGCECDSLRVHQHSHSCFLHGCLRCKTPTSDCLRCKMPRRGAAVADALHMHGSLVWRKGPATPVHVVLVWCLNHTTARLLNC